MAELEILMLANHAEATNGLLYVLGGGWTHHWRPPPPPQGHPQPSSIAIAAAFLIDKAEDDDHPFSLRIEDEAGTEVVRMEGSFRVGDPRAAEEFPTRNAFAANANVVFAGPGAYRLVGEVDHGPPRVVSFWVHDGMPQQPERSAAGEPAPSGYL
ncbi:MAG: DUF6941 family protein [Actinomycetota bacterium]